MTTNSTNKTRTNTDLIVFCIVTAIIVGTISTSMTLHYMNNHVDLTQQQEIDDMRERQQQFGQRIENIRLQQQRFEERMDIAEQKLLHRGSK